MFMEHKELPFPPLKVKHAHEQARRVVLLTTAEVADTLRVTTKTLARWRNQKTGPAFIRQSSNVVLYSLADVEAWLDSKKATSAES